MRLHLSKLSTATIAVCALLGLSVPALAQAGGAGAHAASRHHVVRHRHHRHHSAIPQHNGGDQDADNNGGPSDGDGNI
jgi:hypothetical protein